MVVMTAVFMFFMVMVVMTAVFMLFMFKKFFKFIIKCIFLCHCIYNLFTGKLVPVSSNNRSRRIKLTYKRNSFIEFFLRKSSSMAKNYTARISNLIIEKFTEILLIHFTFLCINNSSKTIKFHIVSINIFNSINNITEFSYS